VPYDLLQVIAFLCIKETLPQQRDVLAAYYRLVKIMLRVGKQLVQFGPLE
jgi:hypothetical protein